MAPPSGKYQLQFLWWVWSHCRNPEGSGTQEGKTYRGEAAEQDDAAAAVDVVDDVADAAVVAGQKPVGTVAAVREGREGEEGGGGNEGRTIDFMAHYDDEMLLETSSGFGKLGTRWRGGMRE